MIREKREQLMSTIRENIKDEEVSRVETIDFKMVTFSLAGKEYGIDIMKVKEISKANRFTFVPNSAPFVRGVYNLRGDIISVIDMRSMFNLPVPERKERAMEDMIILRLEELLIGVIVDSIDKVVGINSESVQPPHPIFGDINIKFIKGVVENDGKLYLILDVERILGQKDKEPELGPRPVMARLLASEDEDTVREEVQPSSVEDRAGLDFSFVVETLKTFRNFIVSPLNHNWAERRFEQWKGERGSSVEDVQLQNPDDADLFLRSFYSDATGNFFPQGLKDSCKKLIGELQTARGQIAVWNPGCGKGYETYSVIAIVKELFPDKAVKVWAHDKDLLSISTAPNLLFQKGDVPDYLLPFVVEGKNGLGFSQELKDLVLFEYHDILHGNPFPEVDLIFARDIASFLSKQDQDKLIRVFSEKLRTGGLLVLGKHETITGSEWEPVEQAGLTGYRKKR
jgi:chemotaxis signal transduction protein/chemotaxis methyl-accepting protein methylase